MRIDVFTIFPEMVDEFAGQSLLGRARRARPARRAGPRPARRHHRRAPHGRRRAVRRRRGHGADARAALRRGRGGRPAPAAAAARPRRATLRPGRGRASSRRATGSRCSAAATRASTSGCAPTWSTASCRSATSCSPAARSAALVVIEAVGRLVPGVMGNASVGRGGVVRRRAARVPAVHPAGRVPGLGGARGAALGRPRPDRPLAPGAGAARAPWPSGPT